MKAWRVSKRERERERERESVGGKKLASNAVLVPSHPHVHQLKGAHTHETTHAVCELLQAKRRAQNQQECVGVMVFVYQ